MGRRSVRRAVRTTSSPARRAARAISAPRPRAAPLISQVVIGGASLRHRRGRWGLVLRRGGRASRVPARGSFDLFRRAVRRRGRLAAGPGSCWGGAIAPRCRRRRPDPRLPGSRGGEPGSGAATRSGCAPSGRRSHQGATEPSRRRRSVVTVAAGTSHEGSGNSAPGSFSVRRGPGRRRGRRPPRRAGRGRPRRAVLPPTCAGCRRRGRPGCCGRRRTARPCRRGRWRAWC